MSSYTVSRSKHATLQANTVDTVTIASSLPQIAQVEVKNRGADPITFTVDGSAPELLADNTYVVGPGEALQVPALWRNGSEASAQTVKLKAASAVSYSVTGT